MAHHPPLEDADFSKLRAMVNEYARVSGLSDSQIAREAGVDQPMIHTVRHGKLKKRTARVTRLELYISIRLGRAHPVKTEMDQAVSKFISAGGDVALLPRGIAMLAGVEP
jgi:hypothetical protein